MPDKKSGFLSDYRAAEDGLNFGIFKPALRNILESAETPLTVGVFGTWGSGKTTLLNMLKDELDAKKLPSLKTVWFTAWKYEQHQALWRAFMLRVVDGLHPRKEDGTRYLAEELPDAKQKAGVEHLGRLERSIYETVNWQDEGQWSLDTGELVKQGSKLPIWLVFHLAGLGDAAKDLGLNPEMAKLLEREVREHHLNQLSYMEQFAAEFQKAVQLILGKDGRLVVFVDDLDRCLPEKAVEVLEAIKLFLDVPGTVFALGMDREVIRRGIETHYRHIFSGTAVDAGDIPLDGDLYLQKMIQIPFQLPPLRQSQRESYLKHLESLLPSGARLPADIRKVFVTGLYPNPRQVKRALNVYNLLKQVAEAQDVENLNQRGIILPLLVKAVLIQTQWPNLYADWCKAPSLLGELEKYYRANALSEEEEIRGLPVEKMAAVGSGIAAPYLSDYQKYKQLREMLLTLDEKYDFQYLPLSDVDRYLGLTGSVEEGLGLLASLETGDPVHLRGALARVDEIEKDKKGIKHRELRNKLTKIACNPDIPAPARANCADLADEMGYIPDDLHAFVPVAKGGILRHFAKYPVTNAQYARFLKPENFENKSLWVGFPKYAEPPKNYEKIGDWGDDGWDWISKVLKDKTYQEKAEIDIEDNVIIPYYWRDHRFGVMRSNAPVGGISWYEANAYCKWLLVNWDDLDEGKQGLTRPAEIRLPTEKEWVLAAGGQANNRFSFGELMDIKDLPRFANTEESGINRTTPVWMYPQQAASQSHGLMDMSGNIFEWQANYYGQGAFAESNLARRGGSWYYSQAFARASYRYYDYPHYRNHYLGFRVIALPS